MGISTSDWMREIERLQKLPENSNGLTRKELEVALNKNAKQIIVMLHKLHDAGLLTTTKKQSMAIDGRIAPVTAYILKKKKAG